MSTENEKSGGPARDQWRLYVESLPPESAVGGYPDALINLEVSIRRRIVIPNSARRGHGFALELTRGFWPTKRHVAP